MEIEIEIPEALVEPLLIQAAIEEVLCRGNCNKGDSEIHGKR